MQRTRHGPDRASPLKPGVLWTVGPRRRRFEQLDRLKGVSLLVVEDDPDSREMLAATFAGCGAKVRAVASAAQARDALERAAPDVLVSDIGLPGENGYTLIRKVRAADAERGRRIPALALTAFTRPEERQEAIDAGFDEHLPKPVVLADVVDKVAALARHGR
jgi:CheY-like chemotaxis protein